MSACAAEPVAGDASTSDCGRAPVKPGVSAAFDGQGNATMTLATYNAITAYLDASSTWIACKEKP